MPDKSSVFAHETREQVWICFSRFDLSRRKRVSDQFLIVWFQDKNFLWQINIMMKDILSKLKNVMDRVGDRAPARDKYFQTQLSDTIIWKIAF